MRKTLSTHIKEIRMENSSITDRLPVLNTLKDDKFRGEKKKNLGKKDMPQIGKLLVLKSFCKMKYCKSHR